MKKEKTKKEKKLRAVNQLLYLSKTICTPQEVKEMHLQGLVLLLFLAQIVLRETFLSLEGSQMSSLYSLIP